MTTEHYVIASTWDGRRLITLCGDEVAVRLGTAPAPVNRCAACTLLLPGLDRARDYARERGITPAQAARALNLGAPSVRALRADTEF